MRLSREVKVAVLVIVGVFVFIVGYSYLKKNNLFSNSKRVFTFFENVEGLGTGAKVTIAGYAIGSVDDIVYDSDISAIRVRLSIDSDIKFSNQSIAILYETSIIGGRAIQILPEYDGIPIQSGDTLPSKIKPVLTTMLNDQLAPLRFKLESMVSNLDTLLVGINEIFDESGRGNLTQALNDFSSLVGDVNQISEKVVYSLDETQHKVTKTLDNVAIMSDNLRSFSDSITEIDMKKSVTEIDRLILSINGLVELVKSDQGTLGLVMQDTTLYHNLNQVTTDLSSLLTDLENNPKRYVHFSLFGRKDKPKKRDN